MKNNPLISDWLDQQENSTGLEQVIALTEKLEVPSQRSKEEAWDLLIGRINNETTDNERVFIPSTEQKKSNQWMYWAAGVAAIFLIGFFGIQNTPTPTSISSELASTVTHELPDQSLINLNAGSTITYIGKAWDNHREVSLSGEAFFEVTKGSTFRVITKTGSIKVLGTSFNVKERDGFFEVSCTTGKVSVSSKTNEVILSPGEKVTLKNNELKKEDIKISEIGAWRMGDFFFNQEPLDAVVKELERQFEIEIILSPDISERIYNGYFNKANLTEALQLVFVPMGLQFEVNEDQVIVK